MISPLFQSLKTTTLSSVSMSSIFWNSTHRWDHAVFVFLYLVFVLSKVSSRFILSQMAGFPYLFLRLNHIFMCMCMCVCMSHTFFIHSSVDGHWGHFHILSSVNNVAMNIGMKIPFWEGISLRYWFHFVCLRAQKCHYWITQQGCF